jgi:hypothetical protein
MVDVDLSLTSHRRHMRQGFILSINIIGGPRVFLAIHFAAPNRMRC